MASALDRPLLPHAACGLAMALSLGACSGPLPALDAGMDARLDDVTVSPDAAVGAIARFAPGPPPLDFGDVPFPSDLYLDEAGHLALGAVPSSRSGEPFFEQLRALLAERDGFSTTGAVHFGIDGALDPSSLPPTGAPGQTASLDDGVLLVDVDSTSPSRGALIPVRVVYDATRGLLSARPARGHTLRPGGRFAAAITSELRGMDGTPLAPSPAFRAIRDGADRSLPAIDGALASLEAAGVSRARIVAAAVLTTERPGRELVELRTAVHGAPPPVARVERVIAGAALDDYFGLPSVERPGVDVPAASGAEGERAIVHATTALVVLGTFTAPRVVTGTRTDVGTARRDASGMLEAGPLEDVPFVLIVPRGIELAGLPVLLVHHGFNASRVTAHVLADTAGRAGMAVLGIDAFQHGGRALGARDELHDLRGSPGSDGLFETNVASVSARTFGLTGPPDGLELFPGYPLGAFFQFTADAMSAVRLVRQGDLRAVQAADPALAALALDGNRIAYLGISMGSVVGASMLAAEPDLRGFVLNVPPGSITDTLCEGAEFRGLATGPLAGYLGIRGPFDEVSRSCANDPIVDLFRWALEPVDPLALAPHFFREPLVDGPRPDVLWLLASHDQLAAPPATESMLAVAGAPGRGEFSFATIELAPRPVFENVMTPSGLVTALALRYDPASIGLPGGLSGSSKYLDPLCPPFERRGTPLEFENPILDVHERTTRFLDAIVRGRRPTID